MFVDFDYVQSQYNPQERTTAKSYTGRSFSAHPAETLLYQSDYLVLIQFLQDLLNQCANWMSLALPFGVVGISVCPGGH
jgi:hypothetical protein